MANTIEFLNKGQLLISTAIYRAKIPHT